MKDEANYVDFDAEDRGGFKHPAMVGEYQYVLLETKVLESIDAGYRTLMRIKQHIGLEKKFDLSPVIEGMELDEKIRRESNGTITAFFRWDQMPRQMWINGDGTVGVEWIEDFRPVSRFKPEKVTEVNTLDIEFDLETVERVARNMQHKPQAAKELGFKNSALLDYRIKNDPEFAEAWDRGRRSIAERDVAMSNGDGSKLHAGSLTEDQVQEAARKHGRLNLAAQALDLSYSTFAQVLSQMPALEKAWQRGRQEFDCENGITTEPVSKRVTHREDMSKKSESLDTSPERVASSRSGTKTLGGRYEYRNSNSAGQHGPGPQTQLHAGAG